MPSKQLLVYLNKKKYGVLEADLNTAYFTYDRALNQSTDTPISLRMLQFSSSHDMRIYLDNLKIEDKNRVEQLGNELHQNLSGYYWYFEKLGLDCSGSIQFIKPGEEHLLNEENNVLVQINESQIGEKLKMLIYHDNDPGVFKKGHASLPGNQAKLLLHKTNNGKWYTTDNGVSSTHILKPGIKGIKLNALNEFVCMKLAKEIGLNTSEVEYQTFDGTPAIIVKRYDRRHEKNNSITRLHQNDLCQVLGISAADKYHPIKGASVENVIKALRQYCDDTNTDVDTFVKSILFNYIIGGADAHLKNYSVLLDSQYVKLAPLYDIASFCTQYSRDGEWQAEEPLRPALPIGACHEFFQLRKFDLIKLCRDNTLDVEYYVNYFTTLLDQINISLPKIFKQYSCIPRIDELHHNFSNWMFFMSASIKKEFPVVSVKNKN